MHQRAVSPREQERSRRAVFVWTMVDNRYATALVIGSVLSLLATVYLSVAVGTQHWYQYSSPQAKREGSNATELREEFVNGEFDEKTYSDTMFRLNGTLGLWWRCILVPSQSHWFKEPGMSKTLHLCSFSQRLFIRLHMCTGSCPHPNSCCADELMLFVELPEGEG